MHAENGRKRPAAAITLTMITILTLVPPPTASAVGDDCAPDNALAPRAEMFATSTTDEIDDPSDPRLDDRLEQLESVVNGMIFNNAAVPVGSDLVQGVFWSDDKGETTYEPSRDFHVACVDDTDIKKIAKQVAGQFHQKSVLVFVDSLNNDPEAGSFVAHVPGIDVRRFHDALAADPLARGQLGGGSITDEGVLVLVASTEDTALAERVVTRAGGRLEVSTIQRGESAFVTAD
jgi:hypothetical protein